VVDSLLKFCLGSRCTGNKIVCKAVYQPTKYKEHQWHCLSDIESVNPMVNHGVLCITHCSRSNGCEKAYSYQDEVEIGAEGQDTLWDSLSVKLVSTQTELPRSYKEVRRLHSRFSTLFILPSFNPLFRFFCVYARHCDCITMLMHLSRKESSTSIKQRLVKRFDSPHRQTKVISLCLRKN
jgi:hypothetical protein